MPSPIAGQQPVDRNQRSEVLRLLLEHRDSLFAYIFATVRNFHLAEDLFQEASVAVCESCQDFRLGTSFGAWSREIARRRILAHFRSLRRSDKLLENLNAQMLQAAFDELDVESAGQDRVDALRRCLEVLTPRIRQLMQLRFVNQMSLEQMAQQVQRQPESVRKALYRGRQVLRECIELRLQTHPA